MTPARATVAVLTAALLLTGCKPTIKPSGPDAVPFSALNWTYGGFDGSHAVLDGPRISNLRFHNRNLMAFNWDTDLRVWGYKPEYSDGAVACLFVQRSDGKWVGGKFDWISSSRPTRDFNNIYGSYNGWSLNGVPNPCQVVYVVVKVDKTKRSNTIRGEWRR